MSTGNTGKKPPIRLDEIEGRQPHGEREAGELSYMEGGRRRPPRDDYYPRRGSSGRPSLGSIAIPAIVAIIFSAILMFAMMPSKADVVTLDSNVREVASQVETVSKSTGEAIKGIQDSVDTAINEARSAKQAMDMYATEEYVTAKINAIPKVDTSQYALKSDVPAAVDNSSIKDDIADLKDDVKALDDRMDELEDGSSSSGGSSSSRIEDTTIWKATGSFISPDQYTADYMSVYVDQGRIHEAGLYDFQLELQNNGETNWDPASFILELTFRPRDYVRIDEDATYVDSDSSPWVYWDADFITRDVEGVRVCREMQFTSERYYRNEILPPGGIIAGGYVTVDLILELVYE